MSNNFTEKRKVMFGDKAVGDGEPCFVTYEAGPTHNGFSSAKELIAEAAKPERMQLNFKYLIQIVCFLIGNNYSVMMFYWIKCQVKLRLLQNLFMIFC